MIDQSQNPTPKIFTRAHASEGGGHTNHIPPPPRTPGPPSLQLLLLLLLLGVQNWFLYSPARAPCCICDWRPRRGLSFASFVVSVNPSIRRLHVHSVDSLFPLKCLLLAPLPLPNCSCYYFHAVVAFAALSLSLSFVWSGWGNMYKKKKVAVVRTRQNPVRKIQI